MHSRTSLVSRLARLSWMSLVLLLLSPVSALADDDDSGLLIRTIVPAALGGTFTDDPSNPRITVTIPPGALNMDARLRVVLVDDD